MIIKSNVHVEHDSFIMYFQVSLKHPHGLVFCGGLLLEGIFCYKLGGLIFGGLRYISYMGMCAVKGMVLKQITLG